MSDDEQARIEVKAAGWYQRYHSDLNFDEEGFSLWLAADPRHQAAYQAVARVNALIAEARSSVEVTDLRRQAEAFAVGRRQAKVVSMAMSRRGLFTSAAAVGLASVLGVAYYYSSRRETFSTGVGEQRVVTLADNSRLSIDANTTVGAELHSGGRRIKLLAGRVHFEVAKDQGRPFIVQAMDKTVTALGTAFSVEVREEHISVALTEGRIALKEAGSKDAPRLISDAIKPGQMVTMTFGTPAIADVVNVNPDEILSWRMGKIVFDDESLATAAARMNDYSTEKVIIDGNALEKRRITGIFVAGRNDAFVDAIQTYFDVTVDHSAGRYLIRAAGTSA